MEITSLQNPRIKEIIKLRKAADRKKQNLIFIEGQREVKMASASGLRLEEFYYCPEISGKKHDGGLAEQFYEVSKPVFKKISLRENPDGWLALSKLPKARLEEINAGNNFLAIVLESVEKPGNLGAIARTADAAGVNALIIADPQTDPYHPNVIRASQGSVFSLPIIACSSQEIIRWLNENNVKIFVAAPSAEKIYTQLDYTTKTAVVIGTEARGLSLRWLKAADEKIKIPMYGRADSLNASVSAAVLVYEILRQRKSKKIAPEDQGRS